MQKLDTSNAVLSALEEQKQSDEQLARIGVGERLLEIVPTTIIFGVGGLGMISFQAVALHLMAREDVGRLVLAYGVTAFGAVIAGLGISSLIPRTVAADRSEERWRQATWLISSALALPIACCIASISVAFSPIGDWGLAGLVAVSLVIMATNLAAIESSYRRATGKLLSGAFVQQAALLLCSAVMLIPLTTSGHLAPISAFWILLAVQCGLALWSARGVGLSWREDIAEYSHSLKTRAGLLFGFWLSGICGTGFRWVDRFVVVGVLSLQDVADYQSIFLMTAFYDLASVGLGYVNLPRYAESGTWTRSNFRIVTLLAIVISIITPIIAVLVGSRLFLIDWKSETLVALIFFMGIGVMKLSYSEVSAGLGGIANALNLVRFSLWMGLSLIAGIAASISLGYQYGIAGAACGSFIAWMLRAGIGYGYLVRHE